MLGDISRVQSIRLVTGYTDMRKSINGLMAIIRDDFKMDPYANALYLFCGRKADRLKALYFDQTGFVLLYRDFAFKEESFPFYLPFMRRNSKDPYGIKSYSFFMYKQSKRTPFVV